LYCGKCGAEISEGTDRCSECGESVGHSKRAPEWIVDAGSGSRPLRVAYAGFWLRFVAFVIDSFILGVVSLPILFRPLFNNIGTQPTLDHYLEFIGGWSGQAIAFKLLVQLISWLYWASLESSAWQATPGKRMLGLRVTDLNGKRVSFARASGRFFGKILSEIPFLFGYVMAGFTARKQALHDMLAGCLVLRKV
jgi:uncharacterized RDD family membrane protein YckC